MASRVEFEYIMRGNAEEVLRAVEIALTPAGLSIFAVTRLRQLLQERAQARFESEGDDASGKWLPLADSTKAIRASLGYAPDHPINVRTGALKSFVTGAKGRVGIDAIGVTFHFPGDTPSPAVYPAMKGAQHGTAKQPARPVAAVGLTDAAAVLLLLSNFILAGEIRAGSA